MKNINLIFGGITKDELIQLLKDNIIIMNPSGERLLNSELFKVTKEKTQISLTEISLIELGLKNGARFLEIVEAAEKMGLSMCPVDVAPFLRLEYSQENSHGMEKKYKTPEGAVTVMSKILDEDIYFPKGFYLRKIDGELWLRGYICDYEHVFDAHETFIFEGTVKSMI